MPFLLPFSATEGGHPGNLGLIVRSHEGGGDDIWDMSADTKLPVWRTVGNAYTMTFANLGSFLALAAIPIALAYMIWIASAALGVIIPPQGDETLTTTGLDLLMSLCQVVVGIVFTVAWIRFMLLGRRDSMAPVQFRLGRREGKFVLYVLLYFLILVLILTVPYAAIAIAKNFHDAVIRAVAFPLIAQISILMLVLLSLIAGVVAVIVVYTRCIFVFPAIALDDAMGLRASWKRTKGNAWRIFAGMLFTYLPIGTPALVISWFITKALIAGGDVPIWVYIAAFAMVVVGYLGSAAMFSVVAIAFRHVTGWRPDPADMPVE